MPGIVDSAPECVTREVGTETARVDDSADFILQANYQDCAGFMTFGPGSTYGAEGEGADALYIIITWAGITFMVLALIAWVVFEHRHLIAYAAGRVTGGRGGTRT
jgi:hypothetical protein